MFCRQIFTGNPQLEINVQHVLIERGGIAADADQEASFGGLGDDSVQRLGAAAVVVEGRRSGEVQRLECLFGAERSRRNAKIYRDQREGDRFDRTCRRGGGRVRAYEISARTHR